MRRGLLLQGVVVLCLCAVHAHATMWCGNGPDSALDHPCEASDGLKEPDAASEAIVKHEERWTDLKGVWHADFAPSATGGGAEIQVYVDPPWAACARSQIPLSVDSFPVVIVPIKIPKVILGGSAPLVRRGISPAYDVSNGASDRAKDYSRIVQKYDHRWMSLAGVIGIAPKGCDCGSCDFTGVEISVQRHFMSSLLKQIPPSADGVPVTLLPSD